MNLYLISQKENKKFDTYDSFVVAANDENEARTIIPISDPLGVWAFTLDAVKVKYLGTARKGTRKGRILGSFNAG